MKGPVHSFIALAEEATAILLAALSAAAGAVGVTLDAPGHVAVEGLAVTAREGAPGAAYQIVDWRGKTLDLPGAAGAFKADGTAALPPLPCGYYRLECEADGTTLAVVPAPESRIMDHGSFYGVDSAQSWLAGKRSFHCPWNNGDTYRTISDLIQLAGVPHVRDRLGWGDVESAPGRLNLGRYMSNANLLHERGILVSGMFHDAPSWASVLKKTPSNLAVVHDFCFRIATAFGDCMGDWEFWNEEDIHFAPEPVWDYAAALKAAYLGFKAARPDLPILPGALCQPVDGFYADALFKNDAAKFGDVFNYHLYDPLSCVPRRIGTLHAFLERHGIGDRAIWITECGTNLEGHSKFPGTMEGKMAHSAEQELIVAEFYPKSQVLLQMAGVARNYFFAFCAYNEANGKKDWGVLRRDGTVKPVYSAISTMTRELASARIVGEIKAGDGLRAYLFEKKNGSQTVVFWSASQVDLAPDGPVPATPDFARTLRLAAPDGKYRLTDTCGMRSVATARDGVLELESTRYPSYVSGLRGLKADIPARPCGRVLPYNPAPDEDLSVIIRAEFDERDFEISNHKTRAVLKGDSGRVRVVVWNLGENSKTGNVEVSGVRLSGLPPESFALGPRGSSPVTFDCTLSPADGDPCDGALVLSARFNGRRSSRLYAPLLLEKKFLASLERTPVAWRSAADWKRNTSAQECRVSWDEKEGAVRFDVSWSDPKTDRWLYPVHDLNLPRECLKDACMIEFEVKSVQDKVENDFACANLMLCYGEGARHDMKRAYPPPIGVWERRRVQIGEKDNPAGVKAIRIGANPKGTKCTFWIRNIVILRKGNNP